MNDVWLVESDNDNSNVTLYAKSLSFKFDDGVITTDFEYCNQLDEKLIKAKLRVSEVEGESFSPYLNVIGAKGLFVNEQIATILRSYDGMDIIPLDIFYKNEQMEGNWFFCNSYSVLDVIDWDKSEVTTSSGGKILFVDNLVLKQVNNPYPDIFRVEGFLSIPFITREIYNHLSKIVSPGYELVHIDEFER